LKILLTGRNGQVGWELERTLPALGEVVATDRSTLELGDADQIRRLVSSLKPDLIVNAAAYTAVDKAEAEAGLAMRINGEAPGILAEEAKRIGALLVHYSTDYVFDGKKRTPYVEEDAPRAISRYAASKIEGERAIAASGCRHLTLRTSWVYGPRASNFYQVIRRKADAGEPMRVVDDQTSVPTTSAFLASFTIELLRTRAEGLLHLVPSGHATRYDFALAVVAATGSQSKVDRAKTSDFPTAARRPTYSVMDNSKAAKAAGQLLPRWQDLLPS
jgi:dTDP-4-dehydrorhamnose reductase